MRQPWRGRLDTIGDPVQCETVIRRQGRPTLFSMPSWRRKGCGVSSNADPLRTHNMHEFQVLAVFAVIVAIYLGLFFASEHFFMKDKE